MKHFTDNQRANRLLQVAEKYGHQVEESESFSDCWVVRGPDGQPDDPELIVYALSGHSTRVLYDAAGAALHPTRITQSFAITLLVHKSLWTRQVV